ncbi:hypothetical protein [Streptomyces sp. MH13]
MVRVHELDPVSKTYDLTGTPRELLRRGVPYDIDIDVTPDALDAF